MKRSSKTCVEPGRCTLRRARPWLGTMVEIRATAGSPAQVESAVNAAFAAVAQAHRLMNVHDAGSELRCLMAAPGRRIFQIHPWTWQVLAAARLLAKSSDGAFDFTMCGRWRDLEMMPGNRVRLRRPILLDLSGIAKGFAVDAAIGVLRTAGMQSGTVNAGGDLRVFGPGCEPLHVRCPNAPGRLVAVGFLSNEAAATSGNYFDPPGSGRLRIPRSGRLALAGGSVTVRAATCLLADGLTKVVAVLGLERAKPLLAACGATALILQGDRCGQSVDFTAYAA
jgi:thiamine biosynthesis lipoprotein